MANTTFSGPVRSLGGFIGATQNTSTGAYTNNFVINQNGTVITSPAVVLQGHASITMSATTGDSITTFAQPANTVITSISILCTSIATVATGDIGFEVGTSSSGAQIVATAADDILDGGTTVPVGAFYNTTLLNTTASDPSPAASPLYASAARNIFLNITNTTTPSARGVFVFTINYKQLA